MTQSRNKRLRNRRLLSWNSMYRARYGYRTQDLEASADRNCLNSIYAEYRQGRRQVTECDDAQAPSRSLRSADRLWAALRSMELPPDRSREWCATRRVFPDWRASAVAAGRPDGVASVYTNSERPLQISSVLPRPLRGQGFGRLVPALAAGKCHASAPAPSSTSP
jgi:hypothetical protein